MRFVPQQHRRALLIHSPSAKGETVDYYSRCGTQVELEDALGKWLRQTIQKARDRTRNRRPSVTKSKRNFFFHGLAGFIWFHRRNKLTLSGLRHR